MVLKGRMLVKRRRSANCAVNRLQSKAARRPVSFTIFEQPTIVNMRIMKSFGRRSQLNTTHLGENTLVKQRCLNCTSRVAKLLRMKCRRFYILLQQPICGQAERQSHTSPRQHISLMKPGNSKATVCRHLTFRRPHK